MGLIHKILAHPATRTLSVDDPQTTLLRRQIIENKGFLREIYVEWYGKIIGCLPPHKRHNVLELGAGAGFFQSLLPQTITSEVFALPDIQLVADACILPLADNSLDAVVMTDVFHHIPDVAKFLKEAARCVRTEGKIVMVEPWRTWWSEKIYTHLHHEPFLTTSNWEIPNGGPLSGANGALPWIVFERDRSLFEKDYSEWKINNITPMMPFSYLLSGGVSLRSLVPRCAYRAIRAIEGRFNQQSWAMFALIELERR
jgi:SAM-dependent methyltransferase